MGHSARTRSVPHLSLGGATPSPLSVQVQMATATRGCHPAWARSTRPHPDPDTPSERDKRPLHPFLSPSKCGQTHPPSRPQSTLPLLLEWPLPSYSESPDPSFLVRLSSNATSSRKPFLVPPSFSSSLPISPRLSPAAPPPPVATWNPGLGGLPSPFPSRPTVMGQGWVRGSGPGVGLGRLKGSGGPEAVPRPGEGTRPRGVRAPAPVMLQQRQIACDSSQAAGSFTSW